MLTIVIITIVKYHCVPGRICKTMCAVLEFLIMAPQISCAWSSLAEYKSLPLPSSAFAHTAWNSYYFPEQREWSSYVLS